MDEVAERGPELCIVAKSFADKEGWQFNARVELIYSNGKKLSFNADTLALDVKDQSVCKSF